MDHSSCPIHLPDPLDHCDLDLPIMTYPITRKRNFRRWYWRTIRRYNSEICYDCGKPVEVVWTAANELWNKIIGGPAGILCIRCFDDRCRDEGKYLRWVPEDL